MGRVSVPSGTVTFLFTDIVGSTKRWEEHPQEMEAALQRHNEIVRAILERHGAYIFKTAADGFRAAFDTAQKAVEAAVSAQQALQAEAWDPALDGMPVRMALNTASIQAQDGEYFGQPLNRIGRILASVHGGQVIMSNTTYLIVADDLPAGVSGLDLGEHRLRDLYQTEHVVQVIAPGLLRDFPPLKSLDNQPNNLPPQPTELIGREEELAAVKKLLRSEEVALVTLTGPGGTGKTRLALQAAAQLLSEFPGGAWFVNLAPVTDPAQVPSAIAQVLGVKETGSQSLVAALKEYLSQVRLLLVLDNFEQIVAAAPLLSDIISSARQLKILVTSRSRLQLTAEHEFPVPPLEVPSSEDRVPSGTGEVDSHHPAPGLPLTSYAAVRLFVERARAARPDFQIDDDNARAIAEICSRLDGLPLAIELAAARIKLLAPQAMLGRLQSRLRFLTGGARDLPARHQTLRSTLEWSHDLLTEEEKKLFRRLAVFRGRRSLEAIESVCAGADDGHVLSTPAISPLDLDLLDGVQSLVGKSLLRQELGLDGEPRFAMLQTLQEYASERLEESGEAEEVRSRHARFFTAMAEEAETGMRGPRQKEWFRRLDEDYENVLAALRRSLDRAEAGGGGGRGGGGGGGEESGVLLADVKAEGVETALRLCGSIWRLWWTRGYPREGLAWIMEALEKGKNIPDDLRVRLRPYEAKARIGAGGLVYLLGDYPRARRYFEEGLAIKRDLGDKLGISSTLNNLGLIARDEGDFVRAKALYEEALAIDREIGDRARLAGTLENLGAVAMLQGDYTTARPFLEEALAIGREGGDNLAVAVTLHSMGNLALLEKDFAAARALHEEGLRIKRELGNKRGTAVSISSLAYIAQEEGDYATATRLSQESLAIKHEQGDKRGMAHSFEVLAHAAIGPVDGDVGGGDEMRAHLERAATLLGAAEALREAIGAPMPPANRDVHARYIERLSTGYGDETALKADWERGREMSLEEAVRYALGAVGR
jgi:predicted ATPase/class 3 adenylate cyclase